MGLLSEPAAHELAHAGWRAHAQPRTQPTVADPGFRPQRGRQQHLGGVGLARAQLPQIDLGRGRDGLQPLVPRLLAQFLARSRPWSEAPPLFTLRLADYL